jgi:hypothetical protein
MTDRSTGCAFLHECCKCRWGVTCGECAARDAQRIGELRMAITQRLGFWNLDERREWQWKSCSNGGAQRGDTRAKECCKKCLCIEARCWASRRLKLRRSFA